MISKELLLEIGKKKGLTNKEHIEKDYFQDLFLFNLYKKTNKFIFKGGTSLYKLYNLKRFSEDLDFSLLEDIDAESAENIVKDISKNEFDIKSVKKTKDSLLIKVSCKGIITRYNTLRIDINFRNKVLHGFEVKNYVSDFVDINPFTLRSLNLQEMISEKIHSIFMRDKARDLFDLFFLLRLSKFDKELTKKKLKIFNIDYNKKSVERKIRKIEQAWEKELKPFILTDLPDYSAVKNFVLKNLK